MGLFGDEPLKEKNNFSDDSEVTSAFASYEAALREALERGPEDVSEQLRTKKGSGGKSEGGINFQLLLARTIPIFGLLLVLALAWAIGFGPLSPIVRNMIAQLNERAMAPMLSETPTPTNTETVTPAGSSSPTLTVVGVGLATNEAAATVESAPSITLEVSPTPKGTITVTAEATPTSSVAGCVPAESITLADVGRELCVTAQVFKAEVFETYFSVRTGEDFYYVSYAKGWYAGYGTTWELEKGDCVYATGKIEQIGSYPLMQVGYKNPLKRCEVP